MSLVNYKLDNVHCLSAIYRLELLNAYRLQCKYSSVSDTEIKQTKTNLLKVTVTLVASLTDKRTHTAQQTE